MGLYKSLVLRSDMYTDREVQEANYENIITTANNGISTFRALEQVQRMLGDFGDDIANNDGRLLAEEVTVCDDVDDVCKDPSSTCNCDDEGYFCNCEPNYPFMKLQRLAGCDRYDSDGDGIADNCEDIFPPRLVVNNASLFLCDETDPQKLCYSASTFKEYSHAENFILNQVQVNDDCAKRNQLSIGTERIDSSVCGETTYSK